MALLNFELDGHAYKTARLIGLLGLAWASLELISYLLIKQYFMQLLENNPKLAGQTKQKEATAMQMMPRVVCFVHNVIQIPLGLVILLDPFYNRNAIWARDDFSSLVMAISAGYFLYDTLECMYRLKHEGWDFLLHGVFCLTVYSFLTHTGYLHFYGAGFLMWELSTPFMHFRWFLYKIGKDTTKLYQYNALAGMAVFFLCRILWGNFLSIMFWVDSVRVLATPAGATLPMAAIWVYRVATVVMNGLNAWWFSKMVTILLEAVRGSSSRGMSKKVTAKAL
eukprot:GHRQ01005255.1.p1 GENE.GHRQ01005255.1~~GHRQ01005255.1.p1  ORF type:complete len:280 (+),score=77.26 GHRQ01005255.1:161-1000(+)